METTVHQSMTATFLYVLAFLFIILLVGTTVGILYVRKKTAGVPRYWLVITEIQKAKVGKRYSMIRANGVFSLPVYRLKYDGIPMPSGFDVIYLKGADIRFFMGFVVWDTFTGCFCPAEPSNLSKLMSIGPRTRLPILVQYVRDGGKK